MADKFTGLCVVERDVACLKSGAGEIDVWTVRAEYYQQDVGGWRYKFCATFDRLTWAEDFVNLMGWGISPERLS